MASRREDRLSALLTIAIGTALAAGSLYLSRIADQAPGLAPSADPGDRPESFAESVMVNRTRKDGTPAFLLTAERLDYFRADDSTVLERPVLVSLDTDRPTVSVRARTGRSGTGGSDILLTGGVLLDREADGKDARLTIETEEAQILPDDDIARSDRPVVVRIGADVLTGTGMEFNNRTRILTVDRQVRATFLPAPRTP